MSAVVDGPAATALEPTRWIAGADGVEIAIYEEGVADGETLLLMHGWPDSHRLWDNVVPLLRDRYRIIRIDNRGHGASANPRGAQAISTRKIADDYVRVISEVSDGRVHILAHDWGAVASWDLITRPGAEQRVASFTAVSGPSMGHFAAWARRRLARPTPRNLRQVYAALSSFAYSIVLSLPVLPKVLLRHGVTAQKWRDQQVITERVDADRIHLSPTFSDDIVQGSRIYRATLTSPYSNPLTAKPRQTSVPVQVLVGRRDPAIRHQCFDDAARWVDRVWLRVVEGGHWLPFSHPELIAESAVDLIETVGAGREKPALRRWRIRVDQRQFDNHIVVVTGAGSGIGRQTALAFAAQGAQLVISDRDIGAVRETADLITRSGGVADPYALDVSDHPAIHAHAAEVIARHGVPDVLVNNAGIGQAGRFLDTPADDFDRVLQVNLQGVVGMCRAFAGPMVRRGLGGHIVNLSSMAAYAPQQQFTAYSTSKSAVFMFSDCLRAELQEHGIGVTTVCPGVVHTNITATTRFSGVSADQERDLQHHFDDVYRKRGYGPEKVARRIVRAVRDNEQVVPVTPEAVIQYHMSRLAPGLTRRAAARFSMVDN